jgi:hypothetical protein
MQQAIKFNESFGVLSTRLLKNLLVFLSCYCIVLIVRSEHQVCLKKDGTNIHVLTLHANISVVRIQSTDHKGFLIKKILNVISAGGSDLQSAPP